jgi:hypothetical protein
VVGVLVGSESDRERIQEALDELERRGIPHELEVRSAHRDPDGVADYCRSAQERGMRVLIAAAGLAAYGLFVVIRALVSPEHADPDLRWARRGLPVPLSIDNVAAGASLGVAGYSPWLAPVLFGVTTFVMSLAGHQIGRAAAHFVPRIRTDLLTGLAFVVMAVLVVMGTYDA